MKALALGLSILLYCVKQTQQFSFCLGIDCAQIQPDVVAVVSTIDAMRRAALPVSWEGYVAIGISEAIAGGIGGYASRTAANAIGDKKKDTLITKISSTGVFFGSRSVIGVAARAMGIPRPLIRPIASVAGSILSEGTKALGRKSALSRKSKAKMSKRRYKKALQKQELDRSNILFDEDEALGPPEIVGDISKWLVYDALMDTKIRLLSSGFIAEDLSSFTYGAFAAVVGLMMRDLTAAYLSNSTEAKGGNHQRSKELFIPSYKDAAIEGGILFGCYMVIMQLFKLVLPENVNGKFLINQLIENVENHLISLK